MVARRKYNVSGDPVYFDITPCHGVFAMPSVFSTYLSLSGLQRYYFKFVEWTPALEAEARFTVGHISFG